MINRIREWLRRKPQTQPATEPESRADKYQSTNALNGLLEKQREAERLVAEAFQKSIREAYDRIQVWQPMRPGAAMDSADPLISLRSAMDDSSSGLPQFKQVAIEAGAQLHLMPWFLRHGFIGYQNAAFLAQHWLIFKACAIPVDDAIRNGYDIMTETGEDLDEDALKLFKRADRRMGIKGQLRDFGVKGRIFGMRIALFEVESKDPEYYSKPFNIDGVKPGSYKGISQIDPYWTAPILDMTAAAVPSARNFYEPTWWLIGARRVHRSHLVIFKYADPPDVMKPLYLFGGIPLPQMIMERVYCAERTANEAPALALSKRTTVWMTDMGKVQANPQKAQQVLENFIANRDNFGIKLGDKESETMEMFDTPLGDFDGLVMTQYGLVAATAGVPITKLMGSSPGGFQATGEYDEASYHEMLESLEERDLSPLLDRHHLLVLHSVVLPKFPELSDVEITHKSHELDAMTHTETAQNNLTKAQTDAALIAAGSLTPEDSRARIAGDKESGYHGIGIDLEIEELPADSDDPEVAAEAARGGSRAPEAAVKEEEKTGEIAKGARDGASKRRPRTR